MALECLGFWLLTDVQSGDNGSRWSDLKPHTFSCDILMELQIQTIFFQKQRFQKSEYPLVNQHFRLVFNFFVEVETAVAENFCFLPIHFKPASYAHAKGF